MFKKVVLFLLGLFMAMFIMPGLRCEAQGLLLDDPIDVEIDFLKDFGRTAENEDPIDIDSRSYTYPYVMISNPQNYQSAGAYYQYLSEVTAEEYASIPAENNFKFASKFTCDGKYYKVCSTGEYVTAIAIRFGFTSDDLLCPQSGFDDFSRFYKDGNWYNSINVKYHGNSYTATLHGAGDPNNVEGYYYFVVRFCDISMIDNGYGKATSNLAYTTKGEKVTVKATPDEGYHFKKWEVLSGGVNVADENSRVSTFVMGTENVSLKAIFEKDTSAGEDSSEGNYLDALYEMLYDAIAKGGEHTIYWNIGYSLPYDVMKILQDNPQLTLVFEYSYEGGEYKVVLNGKYVTADPDIPWCGPLYLNGLYGKAGSNSSGSAAGSLSPYIVKKGDTLSKIAALTHTTVRKLAEDNGIENPNLIWPGQILK